MNVNAPLDTFVPEPFRDLEDPARDLPRIAKDPGQGAGPAAERDCQPAAHARREHR